MDDTIEAVPRRMRMVALLAVGSLLMSASAGCSLAIMAGKVLFGDPMTPSAFKISTGVDLRKDESRLLVLCSMPSWVEAENPSIEYDVVDGVARRLRRQGIEVVDPGDVGGWIDDHGTWDDPAEVAADLDADFIAHIDFETLTYQVEKSPDLYQGKSRGTIFVYEVTDDRGEPQAFDKMSLEFDSQYPFGSISADQTSASMFKKQYLDRVCSQLALKFYDHRISEEIE